MKAIAFCGKILDFGSAGFGDVFKIGLKLG